MKNLQCFVCGSYMRVAPSQVPNSSHKYLERGKEDLGIVHVSTKLSGGFYKGLPNCMRIAKVLYMYSEYGIQKKMQF